MLSKNSVDHYPIHCRDLGLHIHMINNIRQGTPVTNITSYLVIAVVWNIFISISMNKKSHSHQWNVLYRETNIAFTNIAGLTCLLNLSRQDVPILVKSIVLNKGKWNPRGCLPFFCNHHGNTNTFAARDSTNYQYASNTKLQTLLVLSPPNAYM